MGNQEDIQDMLAFQGGDERGFHRLFQRYQGPLINYLYRFTGNHAAAEELMQDAFFRLCRAAGSYEPRTAFRTWLYQIATNVGRNEIRKREYAVKKESLSPMSYGKQDDLARANSNPDAASPEEMARARQMEQLIQQVLSRLPEKQRAALLLKRHHGLSYQEISGVMNLRVGAVKSLIHRATGTLRKHLYPYLEILPQQGEEDAL